MVPPTEQPQEQRGEGWGQEGPPHHDDPGLPGPDHLPFPIVAIGASAGGLEAVTSLLRPLPADPGLSILLAMHQSPDVKSELPAVLARLSPLPVVPAEQGMKVEVNRLYVGRGNASMRLIDGKLTMEPRPPRGVYMPIDHLFRSLAAAQKGRAVGVVLSGEGTDGALGFQAIKGEGGITFAQDEKSARHDSMPRSAAADGHVDYILPPERIAQELLRIARHPYAAGGEAGAAPDAAEELLSERGNALLEQIIAFVRSHTDVDFTHYKRTTIRRRIQRRMALRGLVHVEDYLKALREDAAELRALYHDLLIRVTQFFRDPESFEALKEKVFPALVEGRAPGSPIRVWTCGCATGEEAYSLAICLLEFLEHRSENFPLKVLATDLNEAALEKARAGVYLDNIEIDVSPERLRRFFIRSEGSYQISKAVRELCVFSRHNVAQDPPFSHLDLVSCRNLLIYMDAALQRRVLPILHYALRPGGALFLGSSENVGPFVDLFNPLDVKHRIFDKRLVATPPLHFTPYITPEGGVHRGGREEGAPPVWSALDVQREADRIVLGRYAPVGVVIDETMTVVQFRGRTSAYLEPAPGMASLDLMRMLREGLLAEVRAALTQATAENAVVTKGGGARLVEDGSAVPVRVEVIPFKVAPSGVRFFLVLFQDVAQQGAARAEPPPRPPAPEPQAAQLQQELAALREYLQSVIEEQVSTNEELKSANEEILSSNEELQSTNEELQTAKEEAQSANEELATVNEELRHRNAELARVNNDLVNLLSGVNIPIVMVSRDLRIRRFTPLAEQVFNLIPTDLGRPISDIKPNLRLDHLERLLTAVIDGLTPHESEVQDREGHWYSLRIRPYVTLDNKIDGASVVLLDIDSLKKALERAKAARRSPADAPGKAGEGQTPEGGAGAGP